MLQTGQLNEPLTCLIVHAGAGRAACPVPHRSIRGISGQADAEMHQQQQQRAPMHGDQGGEHSSGSVAAPCLRANVQLPPAAVDEFGVSESAFDLSQDLSQGEASIWAEVDGSHSTPTHRILGLVCEWTALFWTVTLHVYFEIYEYARMLVACHLLFDYLC